MRTIWKPRIMSKTYCSYKCSSLFHVWIVLGPGPAPRAWNCGEKLAGDPGPAILGPGPNSWAQKYEQIWDELILNKIWNPCELDSFHHFHILFIWCSCRVHSCMRVFSYLIHILGRALVQPFSLVTSVTSEAYEKSHRCRPLPHLHVSPNRPPDKLRSIGDLHQNIRHKPRRHISKHQL